MSRAQAYAPARAGALVGAQPGIRDAGTLGAAQWARVGALVGALLGATHALAATDPAPPAVPEPVLQWLQAQAAAGAEVDNVVHALQNPPEFCLAVAQAPWPRTPELRRAHLHRLELLRPQCIGHAGYLATLGALWLELGEPAQALLWLERSLLLDPGQLGAQADHALALAALGEPAARQALLAQWGDRTDVPAPLRHRLEQASGSAGNGARPRSAAARPPNTVDGWVFYSEASLLGGYETNLDHSPRLNEITLTLPDGSLPFELDNPIRPRRGAALVGDASWQLAHSPRTGMILQTGLQALARHAPEHRGTDWTHLQWAANASQQWGLWRGQVQLGANWVGGRDNEAYRLGRMGLALDREAIGCNHRVLIEGESRHHETSTRADGRTVGGLWSTQCPVPAQPAWTVGLALRFSEDKPILADRVGGVQRQTSAGLRLGGPLGQRTRIDASLRSSRVKDSEGYSPLLENNAIRILTQTQLSIELARLLDLPGWPGAEALLQAQAVRQGSNLAIFRYNGLSIYTGVRWRW